MKDLSYAERRALLAAGHVVQYRGSGVYHYANSCPACQPSLWDQPAHTDKPKQTKPEGLARRTDPDTSKEAAKSVNVTDCELAVLKALEQGPAICDELVERTGLDWNTVSPRLAPLRRKGLIEMTEKRLAKSGSKQMEWRKASANSQATTDQLSQS